MITIFGGIIIKGKFMVKSSRISGFHILSMEQRQEFLVNQELMTPEELLALTGENALSLEQADNMIENVVGKFNLPIGIAVNFKVNGKDVLVPMVVEEPSIVAGASYMAKLARDGGGFVAEIGASEMIGQIQVLDIENIENAKDEIISQKENLLFASGFP